MAKYLNRSHKLQKHLRKHPDDVTALKSVGASKEAIGMASVISNDRRHRRNRINEQKKRRQHV